MTVAEAPALLHAVRRALMALSRDDKQKRNNKKNQAGEIDRLFSGHETDGAPVRTNGHEHIFLAADDADRDGRIDRIIVAAPWTCDRTKLPAPWSRDRKRTFERVVANLRTVRAGRLGIIDLGRPFELPPHDPADHTGDYMGKPHFLSPDSAPGTRQEPGGRDHR